MRTAMFAIARQIKAATMAAWATSRSQTARLASDRTYVGVIAEWVVRVEPSKARSLKCPVKGGLSPCLSIVFVYRSPFDFNQPDRGFKNSKAWPADPVRR